MAVIIKPATTTNGSIANAVPLDGAFDYAADPEIANAAIPHVTVQATTHAGQEYYSFTAAAGMTVIFDLDHGNKPGDPGHSFDSALTLYDSSGTKLNYNDDNSGDPGSVGTGQDSLLTHTFAQSGTYFICAGRFLSPGGSQPFWAGATYTLHVSRPPAIAKPTTTANGSFAAAVNLAGMFDLSPNAEIANATTIPHASVVATTHAGQEHYRFVAAAGSTMTFDVDHGNNPGDPGHSFDTALSLYDAVGNRIGYNDDNSGDPGSIGTGQDSMLTFSFGQDGIYYIVLGAFLTGGGSQPVRAGALYTLNVSRPGFTVTTAADKLGSTNPNATMADFGGPGALSLREALVLARQTPGSKVIDIAACLAGQTIRLSCNAPHGGRELFIDQSVTIDGSGAPGLTISGGDAARVFFINSGSVRLSGLRVVDGLAQGGAGAPVGGGGGLGAGGAIFVRAGASLRLDDTAFVGNDARGGAGGSYQNGVTGSGGGGGMGGGGASGLTGHVIPQPVVPDASGGGGGAFTNGGATAATGGGPSGGTKTGVQVSGPQWSMKGTAGGDFSGGGGGSGNVNNVNAGGGGDGGFGGGGGGGGGVAPGFPGGAGGAGGFGGGGGTGGNSTIRQYWGTNGGNGGFGGGGGGSGWMGVTGGAGGFGGGNGMSGQAGDMRFYSEHPGSDNQGVFSPGGGGGAGFGGALFVMDGASVVIGGGVSFAGGGVVGGAGGFGGGAGGSGYQAGSGAGAGSAIFQHAEGITFAPGPGQTVTVSDSIADWSGPQCGLTKTGVGTLILSGSNSYSGATRVQQGLLQVDGTIAGSMLTVDAGAALGGIGTTGSLTLAAGAVLRAQLGVPGAPLKVNGTVSLAGAILELILPTGFTPSAGPNVILSNDGTDPIVGAFANLDANRQIAVGAYRFAVTTAGGDGNDIAVSLVAG